MRALTFTTALCLTFCVTLASAQVTHTITFDTDAQGLPIASGDTIAEQYAAWGVHFMPNVVSGTNVGGDTFADNTDMTATATDFDPYFVANADPSELPDGNLLHSFTGYLNEDGDSNFWVAFDRPVINVSLDVYGAPFFPIYGLDSDFNLVSLGQFNYSPTFLSARVSMSSNDPISYLIVTGSNDSFNYDAWTGYDNIQFTSVPEPNTLCLLAGSGLTSSLLIRRRRRER